MQNKYYKAIDDAVKTGCSVKIFSTPAKNAVTRIEKVVSETGKTDLVAYQEDDDTACSLFGAAKKLMADESEIPESNMVWGFLGLDLAVIGGYTLFVTGLPNGKILSAVCAGTYPDYIPVKAVIEDNVQTAMDLLNFVLLKLNHDSEGLTPQKPDICKLREFVESQVKPVRTYQKSERETVNAYCKALDNALNDKCFAKVFLCGQRYPVTRIEKAVSGQKEYSLMSYNESGYVIEGLFGAAKKFMAYNTEITDKDKDFECMGIEREVGLRGYTLHLMGLSDGKVLSMICTGCYPNYVPLKIIFADNVQDALELLDRVLLEFDFNTSDFYRFAEEQSELVDKYYEKKREDKK